jgi:hypothetical protein
MQLMYGDSTLEDYSLPSDKIVSIVSSMHNAKSDESIVPIKPQPLTPKRETSAVSAPSVPHTSLDSLPALPSFDEVVRSFQTQKSSTAQSNGTNNKSDTAGKDKKKALAEKNAAIAAAANAALAAEKASARSKATLIEDSDSDGEMKAPKTERVTPTVKKGVNTGDSEELLYQKLGLPPMDVWNGDLLLSAASNPAILSNYFPITARQVGGPPIITLPLPSRIEEKLRIDCVAVESYIKQVLQSNSSKRLVIVEFQLNVSAGNNSVAAATLQQDYADFCRNYRSKNRALAFDHQKDAEPTSRMLLYMMPPDSTSSGLTAEFVQKHLQLDRPKGCMWGVVLLPKETYGAIAKRISRVSLEKMQQQAAALARVNKAHQESVAAATATPNITTAATTGPMDPRARPAPSVAVTPTVNVSESTSPPTASSTTHASTDSSQSVPSTSTVAASSVPSSTSTTGTTPSSLAALLSGTSGINDFNSYLSALVNKVQPTTAAPAAASTSTSALSTASIPALVNGVAPVLSVPTPPVNSFTPPTGQPFLTPPPHSAHSMPPHMQQPPSPHGPYQTHPPPPQQPFRPTPPGAPYLPSPPAIPVHGSTQPGPFAPTQHVQHPPVTGFPPQQPGMPRHQPPPFPPQQPIPQHLPPEVRARMEWEAQQRQHQTGAMPPHMVAPAPPSGFAGGPHPMPPQSDSHKRPREDASEEGPITRKSRFGPPHPPQGPSMPHPPTGPHQPPYPPTFQQPPPSVQSTPQYSAHNLPPPPIQTGGPLPVTTGPPPSLPVGPVVNRGGLGVAGPAREGPAFLGGGICRFFFSPKGCVKENCDFSHDPNHAAAVQQRQYGMQNNAPNTQPPPTPYPPHIHQHHPQQPHPYMHALPPHGQYAPPPPSGPHMPPHSHHSAPPPIPSLTTYICSTTESGCTVHATTSTTATSITLSHATTTATAPSSSTTAILISHSQHFTRILVQLSLIILFHHYICFVSIRSCVFDLLSLIFLPR